MPSQSVLGFLSILTGREQAEFLTVNCEHLQTDGWSALKGSRPGNNKRSPSSWSLYRSGSELPLEVTFVSAGMTSEVGGSLSSSFWSLFSYSLRVEAGESRNKDLNGIQGSN